MKEDQVVDVCKITTKVEDFDEAMQVVQVQVGKFEVRDGGSDVNIIFESLKKKLRFKRPQSIPFMVRMVNQRKVQPIGLIRNLKINLTGCDYKISVNVLNMENEVEVYSMLLGWPWLKLAKTHHNWSDSTFTITSGEQIVTLNTIKRINIKSSLRL
jgi:hypothetical protein